jgi:hypothetical protein
MRRELWKICPELVFTKEKSQKIILFQVGTSAKGRITLVYARQLRSQQSMQNELNGAERELKMLLWEESPLHSQKRRRRHFVVGGR